MSPNNPTTPRPGRCRIGSYAQNVVKTLASEVSLASRASLEHYETLTPPARLPVATVQALIPGVRTFSIFIADLSRGRDKTSKRAGTWHSLIGSGVA